MRRLAPVLVALLCAPIARAQDFTDPLKLIQDIYKSYTAESDPPGYDDAYSKRLRALVESDRGGKPDADKIDWDVFVNGNDWTISKLSIKLVSKSKTQAQVRATFVNNDPQEQVFDLVFEDGRWAIDDVRAMRPGHRWIMSKVLTRAPDVFPDEK
jgi:hypothetical protein